MRIVKQVTFNDDKSIDEEMLKFFDGKSFSTYVKELILKDMQHNINTPSTNKEEIKGIVKELLEEMKVNSTDISTDHDETVLDNINNDVKEETAKKPLDGLDALTF